MYEEGFIFEYVSLNKVFPDNTQSDRRHETAAMRQSKERQKLY